MPSGFLNSFCSALMRPWPQPHPHLKTGVKIKSRGKKITQSESTKQPINITGDISHVPWKEAKVLIFRQRREDLQELIPDNLEFLLGSASSVLGFTQLLPWSLSERSLIPIDIPRKMTSLHMMSTYNSYRILKSSENDLYQAKPCCILGYVIIQLLYNLPTAITEELFWMTINLLKFFIDCRDHFRWKRAFKKYSK